MLLATLESVRGDKTEAARILGLSVKTIYNQLKSYRVMSNLHAPDAAPGTSYNG